jgi:hypothetical protein
MDGYKRIFIEAESIYSMSGASLDNFRYARNIYGFCVNDGNVDLQALDYAKNINSELYDKFINQPKGLTGYKGYENKYLHIDDTDSKHILILTYLFDKNNVECNNIVEIGGGFGNMYRLCKNIIKFNNWDIIDIPHISELQKYYLENEIHDLSDINFYNAYNNITYNDTIDLVLGIHSVSEFSWDVFINYFTNVICKSKYFYMGFNKACPSPELINKKLAFLLNNGFTKIKNFDYTEIPHGAKVSYTLFMNNTLRL